MLQHGLGESVKAERRLTLDHLLTLAVREGAILFSAGTAAVIALNVSLGLVFVGLKALFAH